MSDYTPAPGRGTIFKSDEGKPSAYSGKVALPDGTVCYLDLYKATDRESGSLKRDRDGNPYYNVTLKPLVRQGAGSTYEPHSQRDPEPPLEDDEIPF